MQSTDNKVVKPVTSGAERRAYQIAWRIVSEQPPASVNPLVWASARRSREVDRIAAIIQEEL